MMRHFAMTGARFAMLVGGLTACSGEGPGLDPAGTLGGDSSTGTGGVGTTTSVNTGGASVILGSGGTGQGGVVGIGGSVATGGNVATGGRSSSAGGKSAGGAATGGVTVETGGRATGGAATGGGSSVGGVCSVTPVTPNATQQTKNLLCYLYSIYGKSVLSGQQETSWSNPASDITWYTSNGMQAPAILGGDYQYDTSTTTRAIAYWNAGGISMMRYHMGMPPGSDSYENSQLTPASGLLDQVVTPGNANYNSFVSKLDYVATEIGRMKAANAPVVLALFHEYQPNGWFWWSKGSADQFKKIWVFTFNYLTTTKGLNNIVWLAPSSGSPNASWYPGKAYVDVAGPDTYATNQPFGAMFNTAKGIIGATVPITLHETGMVPQPSNIFPSTAPWVLWNIWPGYQKDTSKNTLANVKAAYASTYTITRDEIPSLK